MAKSTYWGLMGDLPDGAPSLQLLGPRPFLKVCIPDFSSRSPSYLSCILKGKETAAFYEEPDLVDGRGDMSFWLVFVL